jgi:serine/threonine protein kinase
VKLLQQLTTIVDQGYVHGDIRESNVMVNPKTGVFTLIDFDWYMPKREFFEEYTQNLGFYNNPPESLLYESVLKHLQGEPLKYTIPTQKVYEYVIDNNRLRTISKFTSNTLNEANGQTIRKFANIQHIQEYFDAIFPSFDSYGLGFTLLVFCEHVYPYKTPIGDKFKDQGLRYTAEEVAVIDVYLQKLYESVLFPMTELRMEKRLDAHTAYITMKHVYEEFQTAMRNLVSNNLERFAKRTELLENYKPKGTRKRRRV